MGEDYEWIKVVYKDEDGKKICSKWIKAPIQGNAYIDKKMKEGLAEMMQPRVSWEIEDTCMNKPNTEGD